MAGIGFSLRSAYMSDGIADKVAALGHATVIAAGPWLLTIISLGLISITAEQISGLTVLAEFRAAIIYSFLLSLISVAPVVIVATRIVADALYVSRIEDVLPTFHGALYLGLLFTIPVSASSSSAPCSACRCPMPSRRRPAH